MFNPRTLAAALAAVGMVGAVWATQRLAASDPATDPLIGAGAACQLGGTKGAVVKHYIQLAQAKNELKPYGDLGRWDAAFPPHDKQHNASEPPLWNGLGTLSYPVTTRNDLAQRYYDQGARLAYAFNHVEAARSFRQAQRLDQECAMCFWGEALVLGPNINAPMEAQANAPAVAAIARAQSLAANATPRERSLIEALAARYSADPKAERAQLDHAYAAALGSVAQRFADDEQIALLYAEALMDLQPWDYWEAGGVAPKGNTAQILTLIEKVLARNPNHPGAIHFYIHMVEASSDPKRAEPYADRLGALMPAAGHLVHMPSHIYYRVGRYLDSLDANRAAVQVDETYMQRTEIDGLYAQGYYPHNVHFLMVSAQMAGDGATAVAAAEKLAAVVSDAGAKAIPWVQPIKAAPYFAHAQFSPPQRVLAIADPGNELPYVRALWHYARAVAHASAADVEQAQSELQALQRLARDGDFSSLVAGGVPAPDVLAIAQHVVRARIAQVHGDVRGAIGEFEAAVAVEDRLAYMEPPYWYYPVRQSLGAALLGAGELDRAEEAFRASLVRVPNNGWALFGLQQVYAQRGDPRSARALERRLARAWAGPREALELGRL
jgi:tetratricopeptide (TPR) repeat protein